MELISSVPFKRCPPYGWVSRCTCLPSVWRGGWRLQEAPRGCSKCWLCLSLSDSVLPSVIPCILSSCSSKIPHLGQSSPMCFEKVEDLRKDVSSPQLFFLFYFFTASLLTPPPSFSHWKRSTALNHVIYFFFWGGGVLNNAFIQMHYLKQLWFNTSMLQYPALPKYHLAKHWH